MITRRQKGMYSGDRSPWSDEGTLLSRGRPPRSPSTSLAYPVLGLHSPTSWRSPTDTMLLGMMAASPSTRHFIHTSAQSPTFSALSASSSPQAIVHFPPVPHSFAMDLAMVHDNNPRSHIPSYLNFQLPTDSNAVEVHKTSNVRSRVSRLSVQASTVEVGTKRKSSKLSASSQTFVPSDSILAKLENGAFKSTVTSNSRLRTSTSTTHVLNEQTRSHYEPPIPNGADLEAMVEVLLELVDEPDASVKRTFRMTNLFAFCPRSGSLVASYNPSSEWTRRMDHTKPHKSSSGQR